jgi:hypothetical protein
MSSEAVIHPKREIKPYDSGRTTLMTTAYSLFKQL